MLSQICHLPPENVRYVQTIIIPSTELEDHLAHGDIEGACSVNNDDVIQEKIEKQEHEKNSKKIQFKEKQQELNDELDKLSNLIDSYYDDPAESYGVYMTLELNNISFHESSI